MGNGVLRGALRKRAAAALSRATSTFLVLTMLGTYAVGPSVAYAATFGAGMGGNGVKGNVKPLASIADALVTYEGVPTVLDGRGSRDLDGRIVKYEWDYDGVAGHWSAVTTVPTVTVTFPAASWQQVRLRVTDDSGATSQDLTHVRVLKDDTLPVAAISMPASAIRGQSVVLDASGSTDPHGAIVSYAWDLDGDGTNDLTTSEPTVQHAWDAVGTYTVWLTVTDGIGDKDIAKRSIVIDQDIPAPPTDPVAIDQPADEGGVVGLSWTASTDDVLGYRVYRAESAEGPFSAPVASLGDVTSYTDSGLANGMAYFYAVTAVGPGGESIRSVVASATPLDNTAPATPAGLAAEDTPADQGASVSVGWAANGEPDLAGYKLSCIDDGDRTVAVVDVAAGVASYVFDELETGRTYRFTIVAYDSSANQSPDSAAVSAVPVDQLPPAAPTGLLASDHPGDEGSSIDLVWNPNTENDLMGYQVFRRALASGAEEYLATVIAPGTTWTDATCENGVDYGYTLRAFDPAVNLSEPSGEAVSSSLDNVAPVAVGSVWAADVAPDQGGSLVAGWSPSASPDVTVYHALCLDPGGDVVASYEGTALSCTFHGLRTGTAYAVIVHAHDAAGNASQDSPPAVATPVDDLAPAAPAAPSVVDIVPDEGGSIVVSWPESGEADLAGYNLYRYGQDGALDEMDDAGFATSMRLDGLDAHETYTFEIRARDRNGNVSLASPRVSGTAADETAPLPVTVQAEDRPGDQGGFISVTWSASTSPDTVGYKVYRDGAAIADIGGTSYSDELYDRDEHSYVVKAVDGSGNLSAGSAPVSAVAVDNLAPAAPTGVTAVDLPDDEGGAVSVSFEGVADTDVDGYTLYCYGADGSVVGTREVAALDRSGDFHDLVDGTGYSFRVEAYDTSGNRSPLSAAAEATPEDNLAPAAPTGLIAEDVPSDQGGAVRLHWTASTEPDLVRYAVYRAELPLVPDPMGGGLAYVRVAYVDAVGEPGWVDDGAHLGVDYSYVVTALDAAANESGPSGPAQAASVDDVAPGAPTGVVAADAPDDEGGKISVSWVANAEGDLGGYTVYRSTTPDGAYEAVANLQGTSWTDGSAADGTVYYYAVSASDASGNESARSVTVSAAAADNLAPGAPTGLTAGDTPGDEGGSIDLAWTAPAASDVAGYKVYRSDSAEGPFAEIGDVDVTSFTDPGRTDGTTYLYQVKAYDEAANLSAPSEVAQAVSADTVVPSRPQGIAAADVPGDEGGAVVVTWNANAEVDIAGYRVTRFDAVLGAQTVDVGNVTSHAFSGLPNGLPQSFAVSAYDRAGNVSALSIFVDAIPHDDLAPAAPAGVAVGDVPGDQGGALGVSWDAVAAGDLDHYTVYRVDGSTYTKLADVTVAACSVFGLADGTTYTFAVTATDASGNESEKSVPASASSADNVAPAVPGGLSATDVPGDEGGAIDLGWNAVTDADRAGYTLYRGTSADSLQKLADVDTTAYTDAAATKGVTYFYAITSRDDAGNESEKSATVECASADDQAPPVPIGLAALDTPNDSGGSIDLSWDAVPGAMSYRVYRAASPDGPFATIAEASGTSYTDATTEGGATYHYAVSAVDADGNESAKSTAASAVSTDDLAPSAPGALAATPAEALVTLNWLPATDGVAVTGYEVWMKQGINGTWAKLSDIDSISYAKPMLINGITYYFKVRAYDAQGNVGAFGDEVSAVPTKVLSGTATTRIENIDPRLTYSGTWTVLNASDYSGGSTHYSNTAGSRVTLPFQGVGVSVRVQCHEGTWRGMAKVYIDGVYQTTVDLYSPTVVLDAVLYQSQVLADGSHTITIEVTGQKNPSAYSATVDVDCFDVSTKVQDVTAPNAPSAPVLADITGDEGEALRVSWPSVSDPDLAGYRVYRSDSAAGTYTLVGEVVAPVVTLVDTGLTPNRTYYYKVTAVDGAGNESARSSASNGFPRDNRAPKTPTGLSAADRIGDSGGAIIVSWSPNAEPDVAGYRLFRSMTENGTYAKIADVTGTQLVDAGLSDNVSYYYKVAAVDGAGNVSALSGSVSAAPVDGVAPEVPSGVSAQDAPRDSGGAIRIDWTANSDVDLAGYHVYRSVAAGGPYILVGTAETNSFNDTGLSNDVSYHYVVTAYDRGLNESSYSAEVSAVAVENLPSWLVPPTGVSAIDVPSDDGGSVSVSWSSIDDTRIVGYRAYCFTSTMSLVEVKDCMSGTSMTFSGLLGGLEYRFAVGSLDDQGNESLMSPMAVTSPVDNLAPPVVVEVQAIDRPSDTGGAIVVSWSADQGDAVGYRVYRSTSADTGFVRVADVSGASFADSGLVDGTTYYYTVSAYDASGNEGSRSAAASSIPAVNLDLIAPTAPGPLALTAANGQVLVEWLPAADNDSVSSYEVWMRTGPSGEYTKMADVTATSYTKSLLVNGMNHWFKVRAVDKSGNIGPFGDEQYATPTDPTAAVQATRYENTDPILTWQGTWYLWSSSDYSAGSTTWSDDALSKVTFPFSGSQVRVRAYCHEGAYRGMANIYIDGVFKTTVDLYSPQVVLDAVLYESPALPEGDHTLTIEVAGKKNVASNAVNIDVDCFDVLQPAHDPVAPATPLNLTVSDNLADQGGAVRLTWTANAEGDVSVYDVYRSDAYDGPFTLVAQVAAPTTAYLDKGLENGRVYYYRISAVDTSGNESGVTSGASAKPIDNLAPSTPSGFSVTDRPNDQGGAIVISWNANPVSDAVSAYDLYRSSGPNGPFTLLTSTASTTYTDTAMSKSATYYYRLMAVDPSGNQSNPTVVLTGTAKDNLAPMVPSGLSVVDTAGDGGGSLDISWSANTESDLAVYRIYKATSPGGPYQLRTSVAGTFYRDTACTAGTTYYYALAALDSSGNESAKSAEKSGVSRDDVAPTGPGGVTGLGGDGYAALAWVAGSDNVGVVGYEVWMKEGSAGVYEKMADVDSAAYWKIGLYNGSEYYFKVRALDGGGNVGPLSAECRVVPAALTAPPVSTRIENTDPAIAWSGGWAVWNEAGYSGGSTTFSGRTGDRATLAFNGTGITVRTFCHQTSNRGIANVYIDGAFVTAVDLFSSSVVYDAVLYQTTTPLPDGAHTIAIEVSGNKNTASIGAVVDIDCFDIMQH